MSSSERPIAGRATRTAFTSRTSTNWATQRTARRGRPAGGTPEPATGAGSEAAPATVAGSEAAPRLQPARRPEGAPPARPLPVRRRRPLPSSVIFIVIAKVRGSHATLRAVAEELGVSTMTVSNAYNRPDQLSAALRERVVETARRLGYPGPDPLARGLRRGRAGALGLVYDSPLSYTVRDAAAVAFLGGVSEVAEAARVGLLLVPGTAPEQRDAAAVGAAVVDGLIVYSVAAGDALVSAALERNRPTVIVDQPRARGVPFVGIDDRAAAREAAEHLTGLWHRRFAAIAFALSPDGARGPASPARRHRARYPVTRARLAGFADALGAAGLSWPQTPVYECPGSSVELGREAAFALLGEGPRRPAAALGAARRPTAPLRDHRRPTAVLATSDELALGAVQAARELGLAVPGDLSVVGFDDVPPARAAEPPLTTVHQDHEEKGRLAAEMLLGALRGEATRRVRRVAHRLVVRGSTGPPPAPT
ncbi:MAG TPA: LacI family DNA-binding transcriptional regulator [Thermoleophilaceae bacterium]|nr:LacI family DNA-binding transcriptional regulator [Thermoleophilaceae bacterium]